MNSTPPEKEVLAEHFRRIDPRYERQLEVEVSFEGKKQVTQTQNISLGGLYLIAAAPLPIGSTVQLRFTLPTQPEPVEVAGDVRWVVNKSPGGESGIGIRFQGLRARDVWALNRFFQSS
ncbi:MAG TPA: PilZ domain-containing protein [Polyangia bacterium]|nr:PilZ domain-containing protein [Polyangia bacterium]